MMFCCLSAIVVIVVRDAMVYCCSVMIVVIVVDEMPCFNRTCAFYFFRLFLVVSSGGRGVVCLP